MNIIKPKLLKKNDTLAIIAPAGVLDRNEFLKGVAVLQNMGFKTKFSEKIFDVNRYLAGSDDEKVFEIENYFSDNAIDGIICARGGYGSIRLINKINYENIKNNPKFFGGYSDITALQLMILKNSGLITYTSPMIQSDFAKEISEFTKNSFIDTCVNGKSVILEGETIKNGSAEGILWGGNLSTIVSLCGQEFLPDEDFVFFTEDLGESVYKIDKMLTQLINIDKFKKHLKGIVFGEFLDIENENWLNDLLFETAENLNVPAIRNLNITHSKDKLTLPIGKIVKLDRNKLFL